jgi:hypothetical protein
MSEEDWITPEKPVYVLCNPPEEERKDFRWGLLWGNGDPNLANLLPADYWAVVKVNSYREVDLKGSRCVEFKDYEIVFRGSRVEAVNTLVSLGADPARISLDMDVKDNASAARTRSYGTSIVAGDGFAYTGACGYAKAGAGGIARTGEAGYAKAGDGGLAIVEGKRFGEAIAGDRGIAIGEERFKILTVGNGGTAIATNGKVSVGHESVGIALSGEWVIGGDESIVIGDIVSGGPGSVLISKNLVLDPKTDEYERQVACGIVGRDGIRPWVQYTVKDGVLVQLKEETNE